MACRHMSVRNVHACFCLGFWQAVGWSANTCQLVMCMRYHYPAMALPGYARGNMFTKHVMKGEPFLFCLPLWVMMIVCVVLMLHRPLLLSPSKLC